MRGHKDYDVVGKSLDGPSTNKISQFPLGRKAMPIEGIEYFECLLRFADPLRQSTHVPKVEHPSSLCCIDWR